MDSSRESSLIYSADTNVEPTPLLPADTLKSSLLTLQLGKPLKEIVPTKSQESLFPSKSLHLPITVTEAEVSELDFDDDSDAGSATFTPLQDSLYIDVVREGFIASQSQWIDDIVIQQWRNPDHHIHKVITEIESLHHEWRRLRVGPFSSITDKVWLEVGQVLAQVGLPWHNNQINMPDEVDTSWPFHFKSFEVDCMKAKGSRVGDPNPSGYICNWGEANCYSIRALQQELREKCPDRKPLLVYDVIEDEIPKSAEKLFGLDIHHVHLSESETAILENLRSATDSGLRPIIFAATLANTNGQSDDMDRICEISQTLPVILHVDASRNFDYVTTLTESQREDLGINKFTLGMRRFDHPLRMADGSVLASTIVAGGSNHTSPAAVVALKPLALGSTHTRVAYTRASDSTLAGSRDAIAPLWVALQELRFGELGFNQVFQRCAALRRMLKRSLDLQGITAVMPAYSLDVILSDCSDLQAARLQEVGASITTEGKILLTVQPSATVADIDEIATILSSSSSKDLTRVHECSDSGYTQAFPVPQAVVDELELTVHAWKVATRSAAGYPFHMGSYSALGPIISHFLDVKMPDAWIDARATEVLDLRLRSFGLVDPQQQREFKGAFTNGSTMGNRVGIHTALTHFPHAFLYFSSETHYSVPKTARDSDDLTNRWSNRSNRYSEIAVNGDGSICVEKLVQQAVLDREACLRLAEPYQMVLFLNMGTTFVGARDNLGAIRTALAKVDIEISYVHMDGALDFGFHDCDIALGPPGMAEKDGKPVVQGVTLSHHKAMGNMVSGEVLCYSPGSQLMTLGSGVDPRAIFETWLYMRIYTDIDLRQLFAYCQQNASRLEAGLSAAGVVTKRNHDSTIVVLERPPAWVTEEFSLRPQEDWVHFITMPHVSADTVDLFVDRIVEVDRQCERAFRYVTPLLNSTMGQLLELKRVPCRSSLADKVVSLAQALVQPTNLYFESINSAIRASLRGAMSVVAIDEHNELQAIFVVESTRERTIRAGPVLVRSHLSCSQRMIVDVARQLIGLMARNLNAPVETDDMSYVFLPLQTTD